MVAERLIQEGDPRDSPLQVVRYEERAFHFDTASFTV
jgi:hypothetical protein